MLNLQPQCSQLNLKINLLTPRTSSGVSQFVMKIKYVLFSFILFSLASYITLHSFKYVKAESLISSDSSITSAISPSPSLLPSDSNVKVIKATYGPPDGFVPTQFTVKFGVPVRLEVTATEDGIGCMGSLMVPDFSSQVEFFKKGKTNIIEFIPTSSGLHLITCGMGIPHAYLIIKE